jgi:hypothetical protein
MSDERVVYGARCSWWDLVTNAGSVKTLSDHTLPACPKCHGPLFEVESLDVWWRDAEHYARTKPDAGYLDFLEWAQGKCYPNLNLSRAAYELERARAADDVAEAADRVKAMLPPDDMTAAERIASEIQAIREESTDG